MALSSLQLEAFHEVAKTLSFSQAAKSLHITQSALSQRVINLEQELELALFIRDASGVRLTEAGQRLLRHCQTTHSLERELLEHLGKEKGRALGGVIRIGGFSSVTRSVVLPALSEFIRSNPALQVEVLVRELRDLPQLLKRGEIDFAVMDRDLERSDLVTHPLGEEELVLVESIRRDARSDVYLDHDAEDLTTESFFRKNGKKTPLSRLKRSFMGDIYGIVDGVALGWGSAVVSRHLIADRKDLRIVPGYKPMRSPIVLHYYLQPFYSKTHLATLDALIQGCAKWL